MIEPDQLNRWVTALDYAGVVDAVAVVVFFVIWKARPQRAKERTLTFWALLISFVGALCWVVDSKLSHQLGEVQARSFTDQYEQVDLKSDMAKQLGKTTMFSARISFRTPDTAWIPPGTRVLFRKVDQSSGEAILEMKTLGCIRYGHPATAAYCDTGDAVLGRSINENETVGELASALGCVEIHSPIPERFSGTITLLANMLPVKTIRIAYQTNSGEIFTCDRGGTNAPIAQPK